VHRRPVARRRSACGIPGHAPAAATGVADPASARPALRRILIATVAAPDLRDFEARYSKWFGYVVRERGRVDPGLAASWGAPGASRRPYVLMSADGWPDVYLRAVRTPAVRGYRPMATWGWNAIELIVEDPASLFEQVRRSPFEVIGEPAPLKNYPSILAFQVRGAAGEVVYLTSERGDRSRSILPPPNGRVGRPFIMVLAGPDVGALLDFYRSRFGLAPGPVRQRPLELLQRAQGYAPGLELPIATARLAEHGNLIEFDGYSDRATARPRRRGELPPGVAMTTFEATDLDALALPYVSPPAPRAGLAYAGRRSATVLGPAGELIELVEATP
jgi:catechol 2,3-dioxygenase-like lactoylglutathione lyase family enzyme